MANLLTTKRFLPLMITQFFGAFNDNVFKTFLSLMLVKKYSEYADICPHIAAAVFIFSFFLFSAIAGQIADKFNRAKVAQILKVNELILMIIVAVAFYTSSLLIATCTLFFMGMQSTFFSPIKYALLPQHLKENELILGNAYIEATTYLAILLGLIFGTVLSVNWIVVILLFSALVGLWASFYIPSAAAINGELVISPNIFKSTINSLMILKKNKVILKTVFGATWFWMVGGFILAQIYALPTQVFNTDDTVITIFLLLFSIGVACGSLTCHKLFHAEVKATYVPLSAFGMTISLFALFILMSCYSATVTPISTLEFLGHPIAIFIAIFVFLLAFFGGLYVVPLNAMMQALPAEKDVATVIVANNIINSFGMTAIALISLVLLTSGSSTTDLFLYVAIASLAVSFYVLSLLKVKKQ